MHSRGGLPLAGCSASRCCRSVWGERVVSKKLLAHERQTGSLAAKPASGGRARYLDATAQAWLVAYVGQNPDITLAELGQAWQAQGGQPVGQTCLWQVLKEQKLRRKKACTRVSATRPAWSRYGRTMSKP